MTSLFVIEQAPSGDVYRIYEGMTEDTIAALLPNPVRFVTEEEFNAAAGIK